MRNFIGFEFDTAEQLPYRSLYDEGYLMSLHFKEIFNHSYIYFFTRVKKVRFDLTQCKFKSMLSLQIGIKIGHGKTIKRTVPLYSLFPGISMKKKDFNETYGWYKGLKTCELNTDKSTNQKLVFDICSFGTKYSEWAVIPEFFDIGKKKESINSPEILYIGQSHDMLERMKKHKTLIKANSLLKDEDEIRIYFLTFRTMYASEGKNFNEDNKLHNVMLKHRDTHPDENKLKINLIERFLINYFKPLYNETHKSTSIGKDNLVKELLIKFNVEGITMGFGMEGNNFKFWSEHRKDANELASFDLKHQEQDFILEGFDPLF